MPRQHVKAGRRDAAPGLGTFVAVREQRVAIGVQEIGGPQRTHLRSEGGDDPQPFLDRRNGPGHPERLEPREQRAERVLRICFPHGAVVQERQPRAKRRRVEVAVVGEGVHLPAQLAHERLAVAKRCRALGRLANMAQHERAFDRPLAQEPHAGAVGCGLALLQHAHVAVVVPRDPPAVLVGSGKAAVTRKFLEGVMHRGGVAAAHREELAHAVIVTVNRAGLLTHRKVPEQAAADERQADWVIVSPRPPPQNR